MSVIEAARAIGVSVSKVYQLVSARQLAHYRVGAKIIIREADVAAYMERCRVGPTQPAAPTPPVLPPLRHVTLR